jgi:hypothetical protein
LDIAGDITSVLLARIVLLFSGREVLDRYIQRQPQSLCRNADKLKW